MKLKFAKGAPVGAQWHRTQDGAKDANRAAGHQVSDFDTVDVPLKADDLATWLNNRGVGAVPGRMPATVMADAVDLDLPGHLADAVETGAAKLVPAVEPDTPDRMTVSLFSDDRERLDPLADPAAIARMTADQAADLMLKAAERLGGLASDGVAALIAAHDRHDAAKSGPKLRATLGALAVVMAGTLPIEYSTLNADRAARLRRWRESEVDRFGPGADTL